MRQRGYRPPVIEKIDGLDEIQNQSSAEAKAARQLSKARRAELFNDEYESSADHNRIC